MLKKFLIYRVIWIILISSAVFSNSQADDVPGDPKIYSSLGCTEIPDGVVFPETQEPYGGNDVRYNTSGWAFNVNEHHSIVIGCPVVRDHANKPMKRAYVSVLNETEKKVICEIEAYDKDGDFLEQSTQFVFGTDSDVQTQMKSNDEDDNDAGPFDSSFEFVPKLKNSQGYYVLICLLPPTEQAVDEFGAGTGVTFKRAYLVKYIIEEVSK